METVCSSTSAATNAAIRTQADELVEQNSAEDFDKFLLLMTEQLRHQDPLNPADPTQFVAQLATFSSVEQSIKSNEKLDQLIQATLGFNQLGASDLIGRSVESATGQVVADGEQQVFFYEPLGDATKVVAQVSDARGKLIDEVSLSIGTERQAGAWDSRDSSGNVVDAGDHTIEILYYNGERLLDQAPAITESRVREIILDPTGTLVKLENGATLPVGAIQAIRETPSLPSSSES